MSRNIYEGPPALVDKSKEVAPVVGDGYGPLEQQQGFDEKSSEVPVSALPQVVITRQGDSGAGSYTDRPYNGE